MGSHAYFAEACRRRAVESILPLSYLQSSSFMNVRPEIDVVCSAVCCAATNMDMQKGSSRGSTTVRSNARRVAYDGVYAAKSCLAMSLFGTFQEENFGWCACIIHFASPDRGKERRDPIRCFFQPELAHSFRCILSTALADLSPSNSHSSEV